MRTALTENMEQVTAIPATSLAREESARHLCSHQVQAQHRPSNEYQTKQTKQLYVDSKE